MAGAGGVLAWSCLVRRLQLRCQDNRARHPRPPGKPHSAPSAAKPFVDHGASILSQFQTVPNLHVNMLGSAGTRPKTSDRSFGRVTSRITSPNVTIAQHRQGTKYARSSINIDNTKENGYAQLCPPKNENAMLRSQDACARKLIYKTPVVTHHASRASLLVRLLFGNLQVSVSMTRNEAIRKQIHSPPHGSPGPPSSP
jgi:hypothetical protein